MLVRKLLCWWWWILSLVREIWGSSHRRLSETCFWCDIKIRNDTLDPSPGLLQMMQSARRETLHSHHLYLSRETLSTSLVEELCPTVMLVWKLLYWWWWILSLVREIWGSSHRRISETCFWCDIKIRNDTLDRGCYWWWLLEEKLHLYLSHETLSDCHVSQKTAVLMMMMDSSVNEREMQFASLKTIREQLWCDIKIRNDRRETLHSGHLYLSRETLSDCRVSHKTAVLMMMDSCVSERENEVCFIQDVHRAALMWYKDQKRQKRNSALWPSLS